jgi:hypothetical protein
MDAWRKDWTQEKQHIASRLASGECGGTYGEAVLILCSALSALAAEVWPGERIDRKRFVELLKEYAPPHLDTTQISIPLLIGYLRSLGKTLEMRQLEKVFLNCDDSLVLTGDDVDKTENEILSVCNTISSIHIRECSYANLLYREVRSGYAHEYKPMERADSRPMTQRPEARISYGNWVDDPDRHIHFHINWLAELSIATAEEIDKIAGTIPHGIPTKWWIDG